MPPNLSIAKIIAGGPVDDGLPVSSLCIRN